MSAAHGPGFVTNWLHRDPYTLPQLGEVIPMGWRRPAVCKNCRLGATVTCSERSCGGLAVQKIPGQRLPGGGSRCRINCSIFGRLHGKPPMDQSEVSGIARSVQRYRLKWITKGKYFTTSTTVGPYGEEIEGNQERRC